MNTLDNPDTLIPLLSLLIQTTLPNLVEAKHAHAESLLRQEEAKEVIGVVILVVVVGIVRVLWVVGVVGILGSIGLLGLFDCLQGFNTLNISCSAKELFR